MKLYDVRVYNGLRVVLYSEIYKATDENEAIKKLLSDVTICDGDTITIEEVASYD